jgi:hypothetical protein
MSWAGIASNQTVSWANLQDAVSNNVFIQIGLIPPPGIPSNREITKLGALTTVDIQTTPLVGTSDNQLVVKSELVASAYTYYQLNHCSGGPAAWTKITPVLGLGQRYVLPGISPVFYYYNGISQTTLPAGYNGSIQIVSGSTYCP